MREFGLAILGRAVCDVTFSEMTKPFAHAMAVGHAAHGAELVLKARIAQEHPLLIFSDLPRSTSTPGELTMAELFEHGRTAQFHDLPELLWATTGIRMARTDQYQQFGRLRNAIIHFAAPAIDLACETLCFVFQVMEPLVEEFWQASIVNNAEEWDCAIIQDGYLEEQLRRCGIAIDGHLRAALGRERAA